VRRTPIYFPTITGGVTQWNVVWWVRLLRKRHHVRFLSFRIDGGVSTPGKRLSHVPNSARAAQVYTFRVSLSRAEATRRFTDRSRAASSRHRKVRHSLVTHRVSARTRAFREQGRKIYDEPLHVPWSIPTKTGPQSCAARACVFTFFYAHLISPTKENGLICFPLCVIHLPSSPSPRFLLRHDADSPPRRHSWCMHRDRVRR